ncbi:anti-sigma factor RsbA family regulatory protein [Actinoplanes sp. NPDC089786]|uniref:anti-sigma factor RsbA family regulatory protein n=1 Tax=Actinoplanes sp. NPDC089786 TaxID=3155185 RepID=UPI00342FC43F
MRNETSTHVTWPSEPAASTMRFSHSAFLYDSPDDYRDFLVRFIRDGVEHGDAIAMAAGTDRVALVREALGADAGQVRFQPTEDWHIRPVRSIGVWSRLLRTAATAGRPSARLINEIDFQGQDPSWVRAESATNASLAGLNGHLLCPYDRSALAPELIEAARRTHHVLYDGGWTRSDEFVEPRTLLAAIEEPPYPATGEPLVEVPIADSVADLRAHLRNRATAECWLPPDRVEVLILALSELATNGIRHGGAHRELRVWLNPGAVVCEVADDGPHPPGPLAGYLPPVPGVVGGMGLWLVGQICDALSVITAGGVTRARFALRR